MCRYIVYISITILLTSAIVIAAQSTQVARCFQFTWLGPRWNNESVFLNATCQEATDLASGVPCVQPLVVSEDGTWPDVDYIWRHHSLNASCIMASNDVCATYTYYFDGHVENSTYMCTRALDSNGATVSNGCYTQRNGSFVTKACFCSSVPGGIPCNNAVFSSVVSSSVFIFAAILIINKDFTNLWYHIF